MAGQLAGEVVTGAVIGKLVKVVFKVGRAGVRALRGIRALDDTARGIEKFQEQVRDGLRRLLARLPWGGVDDGVRAGMGGGRAGGGAANAPNPNAGPRAGGNAAAGNGGGAGAGSGLPSSNLPTPRVSDPKLQNILDDLYKGTTNPGRVGTGTTADAVRNELLTGLPTHGRFHIEKAQNSVRGLQKWLENNPGAPYWERLVAQSNLDDLLNALGRIE